MKNKLIIVLCSILISSVIALWVFNANRGLIRTATIIEYKSGGVQVKITGSIVNISKTSDGGDLTPGFSTYSRWYIVRDGEVALWVYSGDIGVFLIRPINHGSAFEVEVITTGNISAYKKSMPNRFYSNLPQTLKQYMN